jgi:hypothetical protein
MSDTICPASDQKLTDTLQALAFERTHSATLQMRLTTAEQCVEELTSQALIHANALGVAEHQLAERDALILELRGDLDRALKLVAKVRGQGQ